MKRFVTITKSKVNEKSAGQEVQTELAAEPVIRVSKVGKSFGKGVMTVADLSFEVAPGQIFCLLGPSGSGKSTTVRMLTGVYEPSEGQMEVLGVEPYRFDTKTRARIGYMPQQFVLFPELSTLENINLVASAYAMSWLGRGKKVKEALEFVGLWEARHRLASQLSGGMRRRLDLACTLVHHPELIFVDEPTAGIDPILRAKFWEHFKNLRDEGRTLFVTTQYVTEADYCDVVAILNRGRLLALGTPEEIRRHAMGGEIINLSLPEITSQALRLLKAIPGVQHIQTISSENLKLTVDRASEALQEIVAAFQQHSIPLLNIDRYHPDFEEVFVRLMEQDLQTPPALETQTEPEEIVHPADTLLPKVAALPTSASTPPATATGRKRKKRKKGSAQVSS
jgi:ABC-2 type transport system ATP-binding protein